MDFEWIKAASGLIGLAMGVITLGGVLAVWFRKRVKAVVNDGGVPGQVNALRKDVDVLKTGLDETKEDVERLDEKVSAVEAKQSSFAGEIRHLRTEIEGVKDGQNRGFARIEGTLGQLLGALLNTGGTK